MNNVYTRHKGSVILTDQFGRKTTDNTVEGAWNEVSVPVEINPGDRVNPTAWKYDVRSDSLYQGWYRYPSYPPAGAVGNIYTGNGCIYEFAPWERASLYNRALNRLNEKARDRSDWSEDVLQFPETRKLLHPVKAAQDMLRDAILSGREDLPKRKPKLGTSGHGSSRKAPYAEGGLRSRGMADLASASKLAASMQLQTAFALRPLVGNIYDTAISLLNKGESAGFEIRGGAKEPIRIDKKVSNLDIYASSKTLQHVERGTCGVRIHVTLHAQPAWNPLDLISLNPALWAWNALPYSFVVDWFFDIGGYLENLENAFRYNAMFKSGYITYLYANYVTETSNGHYDSSLGIFVDFARARTRKISFEREVLHAWPLPRTPRLNVDLGSGQLLSAAALLRGLLK